MGAACCLSRQQGPCSSASSFSRFLFLSLSLSLFSDFRVDFRGAAWCVFFVRWLLVGRRLFMNGSWRLVAAAAASSAAYPLQPMNEFQQQQQQQQVDLASH